MAERGAKRAYARKVARSSIFHFSANGLPLGGILLFEMAQTTANISELLEHAAWARRVAMYVAATSAEADDAVQDAWLAALENPPQAQAQNSTRPWLGTVVRNAVRARFRSASRREQREAAATDRTATAPSTEQLLAAAQMQRQLANAVLQLDEPYRTTVLLRFYQELSSAEIARQQNIPEGTVRWRLKAALSQLRTQLASPDQHELKSWIASLVPTLPAGSAPTAVTAPPALLKGIITMKSIIASVAVIGGIGVAIIIATQRSSAGTSAAPAPPATKVPALVAPVPVQPSAPATQRPKLTAATRAALQQQLAAAQTKRTTPAATTPAAAAAAAPPPLLAAHEIDPAYVRERINELKPLFIECYENTLATDPSAAGKITVRFTIVGEPDIGGMVSESEIIDADSTIKNPEFRQCMQESMFAANFEAPEDGGTIEVRYPFDFRNTP